MTPEQEVITWFSRHADGTPEGVAMTPEQEVIFWRHFYDESLRLFGDKQGTLREMTERAMKHLATDCYWEATYLYERRKTDTPSPPAQKGRFDVERFKAARDEKTRQDWSKSRPPGRVQMTYAHAHLRQGMNKEEAIRHVAIVWRFPSYDAAYQFLKREGIRGLPSTWPKAGRQ